MQKEPRKSGVSLKRVLMAVGTLALLFFWTTYHANFVLARSLMLAFPDWDVSYRSAWPLWSGGVVAKNVKLVPPEGEGGGTFEFADVRLSVPFFQYYRSGFSRARGALLKSITDLQLEFHNGHGDLTHPFARGLAIFGNASASPFDAEGCLGDVVWLPKELSDMGLKIDGTDLTMAYHRLDGRMLKEQVIHTPGAGRVEFRREMIVHDDYPLFSLVEASGHEIAADEWHVTDEGFVAARNRHCAKKDGVGNSEFVQRHVQSAKRLLEVLGLAPQPKLEEAYRGFANAGGTLDLDVHYDPPIGSPLYGAADMGGWLPRLRAQFAVNGKSYALALTSVTPRPLPEIEDASIYEMIQREGAAAQAVAASAAPVAPAPVAPSPTAIPVVARPAPAASPLATPIVLQKPAAPASAAPAFFADDLPDMPAGAISNYRQLAVYVGRNLTVHLHGRESMHVRVLGTVGTSGDVLVRRYLLGGAVEYVLDRRSFEYALE